MLIDIRRAPTSTWTDWTQRVLVHRYGPAYRQVPVSGTYPVSDHQMPPMLADTPAGLRSLMRLLEDGRAVCCCVSARITAPVSVPRLPASCTKPASRCGIWSIRACHPNRWHGLSRSQAMRRRMSSRRTRQENTQEVSKERQRRSGTVQAHQSGKTRHKQ